MSKTNRHASAQFSSTRPAAPSDFEWAQVELFVNQLFEWARSPIGAGEFYRELLGGCVTLLAAEGGIVWLPVAGGRWRPAHQINSEQLAAADQGVAGQSTHRALLQAVAAASQPQIVLPRTRAAIGGENPTALVLALATVHDSSDSEPFSNPHAIVELLLRPGSSPAVQQGWCELLQTVTQAAADFQLRQQLRVLRDERGGYDQSMSLMRSFQQTTDLRQTAFEIANEGRRFVGSDRLALVVRRGVQWQVLAASGVDRVEPRADVTKRLQRLAAATANWGEPLEYADASGAASATELSAELPPALTQLVEQHMDQSQARRLVVVPIAAAENWAGQSPVTQNAATRLPMPRIPIAAVLVAEQFTSGEGSIARRRVLELATLCEPALRQAPAARSFSAARRASLGRSMRANQGKVGTDEAGDNGDGSSDCVGRARLGARRF